ncbi:MAG: hypothetical protein ACFFDW_14265 [Candidatus Thorarchaeota archaeon]
MDIIVENESTTETSQIGTSKSKMEKIFTYLGPIICFLLTFGIAFTPLWQLSFLTGMIGGLFYNDWKKGMISSLIGVTSGWLLYIIIQISTSNVILLIDQILAVITGAEKLSWLLIIILVIISALIGIVSGILGSSIRKLIHLQQSHNERE